LGCRIEALMIISPPTGASNRALVICIRPEVQDEPLFRATMSRLPFPSRWTLTGRLVVCSTSPVPKIAPCPLTYFQLTVLTPLPAGPLRLSDHTVFHGAASAVASVCGSGLEVACGLGPPDVRPAG
jgi:hypothetical protein